MGGCTEGAGGIGCAWLAPKCLVDTKLLGQLRKKQRHTHCLRCFHLY